MDFLISQIVITWDAYAILRCFSHTTHKILYYFWYICRYNVIWPSQGIHVLLYAYKTILTCFWNIKLVRLVVCVCVCVFGSYMLCIFLVERCFWELNMLFWIFGWVACLIAFIYVFFLSLKNQFLSSSTAFRQIAIPLTSFLDRS